MGGLIKASNLLLDAIQSSTVVSRGIMIGAGSLYYADIDEQFAGEDIEIVLKLDDEKLASTSGLAASLYSAGYLWTLRKAALQSRAKLVSNMANEIVTLTRIMTEGKPTLMGGRLGINKLRANVLVFNNSMKTVKTSSDFIEASFSLMSINQALIDIRTSFREFDHTMRVLQYANTLGSGAEEINVYTSGENLGKLIGAEDAIYTADDIFELRKIADSQKVFQRTYEIKSGTIRKRIPINPFANKEIGTAAQMFLPSGAADDMFSILPDVTKIRTDYKALITSTEKAVEAINVFNKTTSGFGYPATNNSLTLTDVKSLSDDLSKILVKNTAKVTEVAKSINTLLDTKMLPKVATATRASETWIMRGTGRLVEKSATGIIKGINLASSSEISKTQSARIITKAGLTAKGGVKFLGWIGLIDSAIWLGTGLYDLAFVEDTGEGYLANHWGFSPLGWIIDTIIEFAVSEETVISAQRALLTVIEKAIESETLTDVVLAITGFYIEVLKVEYVPFDISFTDLNQAKIPNLLKNYDPLIILEMGIYAIFIKLVAMQWLLPLFNEIKGLSSA